MTIENINSLRLAISVLNRENENKYLDLMRLKDRVEELESELTQSKTFNDRLWHIQGERKVRR